jgi:hypothetical protein
MNRIAIRLWTSALVLACMAAPGTSAAEATTPVDPAQIESAAKALQPVYLTDVGPLAFSDCPVHYSCYWEGKNGGGRRWDAPSCGAWQFSGFWLDNNLESVRNRGNGVVHLYIDYSARYEYLRSVVNDGANVNLAREHSNNVSSIRIVC